MSKLEEHLDQQRWLLNNGLFTESAKNNIYMYGSLVNKEIKAVELTVDSIVKRASYVLYADNSFINIYQRYQSLKDATSIYGLWRKRRLLKKHGNLEFNTMLDVFVKSYCGPSWGAIMELRDIREYIDNGTAMDGDKDHDRGPDNG